jgi:hypothetical protein
MCPNLDTKGLGATMPARADCCHHELLLKAEDYTGSLAIKGKAITLQCGHLELQLCGLQSREPQPLVLRSWISKPRRASAWPIGLWCSSTQDASTRTVPAYLWHPSGQSKRTPAAHGCVVDLRLGAHLSGFRIFLPLMSVSSQERPGASGPLSTLVVFYKTGPKVVILTNLINCVEHLFKSLHNPAV